jgi:penicillin-binding protein A
VLASHDFTAATNAAKELNASKATLARSFQETFFPGSTFKIVTATAGVERGGVTKDAPVYPVATSYQAPGRGKPISNFGGESCGGTLFQILDVSCNSSFAQMGVENAKASGMSTTAGLFGFDRQVPIDLPRAAKSHFPSDAVANTPVFLAQASIGQNSVGATPLQMAMVAAAVANQGKIMVPHVMREITDEQGNKVESYDPKVWTTPMSTATASLLHDAMLSVVSNGTATRLDDGLQGFEVGGKTGTAQIGSNPPRSHAWIIGFAGPPGEPPPVAVAVIVEGQEGSSEATGGRVAAPIAAAVMKQALTAPPRPASGG